MQKMKKYLLELLIVKKRTILFHIEWLNRFLLATKKRYTYILNPISAPTKYRFKSGYLGARTPQTH